MQEKRQSSWEENKGKCGSSKWMTHLKTPSIPLWKTVYGGSFLCKIYDLPNSVGLELAQLKNSTNKGLQGMEVLWIVVKDPGQDPLIDHMTSLGQ